MVDQHDWKKKLQGLAMPDGVSRFLAEANQVSAHLTEVEVATKHLRLSSPMLEEVERQQRLLRAINGPYGEFTRSSALTNYVPSSILHDVERQQQALQALLGPGLKMDEFLNSHTALEKASKEFEAMNRAVLGPLADLRGSGILDKLAATAVVPPSISSMLGDYESRFRVVHSEEFLRIASTLEHKTAFATLFSQDAIRSVTQNASTCLEIENAVRSTTALVELHSMGYALKALEPFSEQILKGLRGDLGDWRDPVTFPKSVFGNLNTRSAFYLERGFRAELSSFPAASFEENLESAELINEPLTLVEVYGEPIESTETEDISAFTRTNRAHLWLMRFETQFRNFIDAHMTRTYGEDWPKRQLVNNQYEQWQEKKRKADAAGRPPRRLICYADFTDYAHIICKRDNWKVFEGYFKDPANIRESLQRLHLPRIETMHARPLSQDDELFLYAELKRLAKLLRNQ